MKKEKETEVYKVVTQRNGSTIVRPHSPYYLTYEKGKTISALPGTLGVFCFTTYEAACEGIESSCVLAHRIPKILKVIGIGKPKYPKKISLLSSTQGMSQFYISEASTYVTRYIVPGTVCFQSVRVL